MTAIANIVKSSLGPVGLDKMLVDDIGVRKICCYYIFLRRKFLKFLKNYRVLNKENTQLKYQTDCSSDLSVLNVNSRIRRYAW